MRWRRTRPTKSQLISRALPTLITLMAISKLLPVEMALF